MKLAQGQGYWEAERGSDSGSLALRPPGLKGDAYRPLP